MEMNRRKVWAAGLSVASNIMLVAFKLVVGIVSGSVSVISEAIHSGMDLVAACIALFAVRTSGKPADKDHPFGHGKVEDMSGTIEAILIFVAAAWIIYEAIGKFINPSPLDHVGLGVAVMLFSSIVNIAVSEVLFRVAKSTDSVALEADAWHLRTDVYTSAGVMAALALIMIGGRLFPGAYLDWLDPVVAIGVAILIIRAALHLTLKSGHDLLDGRLPEQEENWIKEYLKGKMPPVRGYHDIRTRKSGPRRFIQFHLLLDKDLSLEASHKIADEIQAAIGRQFLSTTVTIHTEPYARKEEPEKPKEQNGKKES